MTQQTSQTRPTYETEETLTAEQAVAEILQRAWNVGLRKLPRSYVIDYAAIRDQKIVGFVEIKCRNNPKRQYPSYMIAGHKPLMAAHLMDTFGLPTTLAVQWLDALGVTKLNALVGRLEMGGRADRHDPADQEPVLHISIDQFKEIKQNG